MNNPCFVKGGRCAKRHPGCHSECEEYKAFAASREEVRLEAERRRKAKEFTVDAIRKASKRANKR